MVNVIPCQEGRSPAEAIEGALPAKGKRGGGDGRGARMVLTLGASASKVANVGKVIGHAVDDCVLPPNGIGLLATIGEPLRGSVSFLRLTPGSGKEHAATGGYVRQPLTGLGLGRNAVAAPWGAKSAKQRRDDKQGWTIFPKSLCVLYAKNSAPSRPPHAIAFSRAAREDARPPRACPKGDPVRSANPVPNFEPSRLCG